VPGTVAGLHVLVSELFEAFPQWDGVYLCIHMGGQARECPFFCGSGFNTWW